MPVNDWAQAPKYPRVGQQRAEGTLGLQQSMTNNQQHCKQGLKYSLEEQGTTLRADWSCNTRWKIQETPQRPAWGLQHSP